MSEDDTITLSTIIQERYKNVGAKPGKAKPRRPTKPCQYAGCGGWAWARGFCGSHYQQMKREGKLKAVRLHIGDPVARFHASYVVNPDTGCWEWTGWIHPNGYGILPMGGKAKKIRAHRFSWELHFGPTPDGCDVLHTCDVRKCCFPEHLFLGNAVVNMRDCVAKGRHNSQIGNGGPKITPPMALNIRIMYARGRHSMPVLASIYGVSFQTILRILREGHHLKTG